MHSSTAIKKMEEAKSAMERAKTEYEGVRLANMAAFTNDPAGDPVEPENCPAINAAWQKLTRSEKEYISAYQRCKDKGLIVPVAN